MTSQQAQAQFDWVQECFEDPKFVGIAFSGGGGGFISDTELRKITSPEELEAVFQAHRALCEKDVGKSQEKE